MKAYECWLDGNAEKIECEAKSATTAALEFTAKAPGVDALSGAGDRFSVWVAERGSSKARRFDFVTYVGFRLEVA